MNRNLKLSGRSLGRMILGRGLAAAAVAALLLSAGAVPAEAQSRDQIRIVGSSTVYPFATKVAEQFGRTSRFKTPVVESTGTGGGMQLFCSGVGIQYPDLTNASRLITPSERRLCASNGVEEIGEAEIGFDGIVVASSKQAPRLSITRKQLFLALAKEVPTEGGKMVPNPYKSWNEIDPSLPATKIEVLGPPPHLRHPGRLRRARAGGRLQELLLVAQSGEGGQHPLPAHLPVGSGRRRLRRGR